MNILGEAQKAVDSSRQDEFGDPVDNWTKVAALASTLLGKDLSAQDCVHIMLCLKLVRSTCGTAGTRDTNVDIAGYAEILERLQQGRRFRVVVGFDPAAGESRTAYFSTRPLSTGEVDSIFGGGPTFRTTEIKTESPEFEPPKPPHAGMRL